MKKMLATASATFTLFLSGLSLAQGDLPKMTLEEAYDIVKATATPAARPYVGIDHLDPVEEDGFYRLMTIPMFPGAEGTGPFLAVNVWTGDVWDIKYCSGGLRRNDSPDARKLRVAIRKRIGLPEKAYRKLANRRPMCLFP
jgi:hypothetical protein